MHTAWRWVLVWAVVSATLSGIARGQAEEPSSQSKTPSTSTGAPAEPASPATSGQQAHTPPPSSQPSQPAAPAPKGVDAETMMKVWESMNAPGKNHEALARFVGTWSAQCTFWIMPDAEPMTGSGTLKSESIYDGRFIRSTFEGTGLDKNKPLLGTSILGYNTMSKKFETFWIDSSTTGMMLATGDASADGKTMTFAHTFDDPLTGGKSTAKYVYAWQGDDSFTFTMYRVAGDKDVKEGEIVYTRKK